MEEKIRALEKACEKFDEEEVAACIRDLGGAINEKYEDGTILSEMEMHCSDDLHGKRLVKLIRLFLENGFDVRGNGGMNGGECLCQLCWSTYEPNILDAAKLLIDAGTDLNYIDEEGNGISYSIGWKSGDWHTGYYDSANLFETYRILYEAAVDGEDYHRIDSVRRCYGRKITGIEQIAFDENEAAFNTESDRFKGAVVLWCGQVPLLITIYPELMIDPLRVEKAVSRRDISRDFANVVGRKIRKLRFLSANVAALILDDGRMLTFAYSFGDEENRFGNMRVFDQKQSIPFSVGTRFDRVYFTGGRQYSNACRSFEESEVFLAQGERVYLFCSQGEDYEGHVLYCLPMEKRCFPNLRRTVDCAPLVYDEPIFYPNGKLRGIKLHGGNKHLYLLGTEFKDVKIMLESKPIEDVNRIESRTDGEKIEFGMER